MARLRISWPRSSSPLVAALHADHDQSAAGRERRDVPRQVGGAHDVEDDVGAAAVGEVRHRGGEVLLAVVDGSSAPSSRHLASLAAEPAVHATRAPSARPTWMAIVPMPLAPPCTSSVSPGASRP